jgi:hypothetical protein
MKTSSSFVKVGVTVVALAFAGLGQSGAQVLIPINNSSFATGTGDMPGVATLVGGASALGPQQVGNTGWYGYANATSLGGLALGFRPEIAVNTAGSPGVGNLNYALGAGLSGLLGLETPEATLYQPLVGRAILANTTYTLSVDMTFSSLLDVSALASRGVGIGLTSNSTTSSVGSYFADSLSSPGILSLTVLGGTTERLTLTFTTGNTVPTGDLGVSIFAGRGNQGIQADLLTSYTIDNVQLSAVPEPHVSILVGLGLLVLIKGHRMVRAFSKKDNAAA